MNIALRIFCAAALVSVVLSAHAQTGYSARPIRLITPYAPGGSSTIVSRIVTQKLTEHWGQSVIVDNRPGGNTIIGTQAAARANPDGYTVLFHNTTFVLNHLTIKKLPYDSLRDFIPVANIYSNETLLAVHGSLPVNTLQEFIAYAKARPDALNHGTAGTGGLSRIRIEMFDLITGTRIKNISYKGTGPVVGDLVGGHIQLGLVPPITVAGYIDQGKVKGLAVTGNRRLGALPQVPTFIEAGLPAYNVTSWNGLFFPAGTPKAIVDRMSAEIAKVLALNDVKEKLASQGAEPSYADPAQFAVIVKDDVTRYARIIKEANIQMDE
jgi:tripartite-type tricarboxylate transporter receptor subunit TctC